MDRGKRSLQQALRDFHFENRRPFVYIRAFRAMIRGTHAKQKARRVG